MRVTENKARNKRIPCVLCPGTISSFSLPFLFPLFFDQKVQQRKKKRKKKDKNGDDLKDTKGSPPSWKHILPAAFLRRLIFMADDASYQQWLEPRKMSRLRVTKFANNTPRVRRFNKNGKQIGGSIGSFGQT